MIHGSNKFDLRACLNAVLVVPISGEQSLLVVCIRFVKNVLTSDSKLVNDGVQHVVNPLVVVMCVLLACSILDSINNNLMTLVCEYIFLFSTGGYVWSSYRGLRKTSNRKDSFIVLMIGCGVDAFIGRRQLFIQE